MTPFKTLQEAVVAIDELMQANAQSGADDEDVESEDGSEAGGRGVADVEEDEDVEIDGPVGFSGSINLCDEADDNLHSRLPVGSMTMMTRS
jgi:hypothetical protein